MKESADSYQLFLLLQVLQYKKRCGDLEQKLQEKSSELEKCSVGRHFCSKKTHYFYSLWQQFLMKMSLFQERSETSNGRHHEDSSSSLEEALLHLEEEQQR